MGTSISIGIGVRFTVATVAKLKCPPDRTEQLFWDEGLPGFGLRCLQSGARRYVVQYRTPDGTQRRERLGDPSVVRLEDARLRAREKLAQVQLGRDPQAERKLARNAVRLSELVDAYLATAAKRLRPRSLDETTRHLRTHAKPLHSRPASTVDRAEIAELLAVVSNRSGGVTANRVRSSLSAMWTWAVLAGRQENNPIAMTGKPATETSRERVLADAELIAIWQATAAGDDYDRIVRLLMLTAARRDEVGRMLWAEIDGDLWTLPSQRTKNSLPHEVPLPKLAVDQLPKHREDRTAVFGRTDNGFSGWSRCKARLDTRLTKQLTEAFTEERGRRPTKEEVKLVPWTLHDLRRTASTWLSENGELPHVVEAVLNHVSGPAKRGVAGVYNRALYREQKRAALTRWADNIVTLTQTLTKK